MTILEQLLAIGRNTFFESVRQPIVLVVAMVATILIILSNPLSAYTLEDDQRMFVDIGLSTIFISLAIVAAFIATSVLSREIENRTVLTVVSKPVSRPVFVVGKYLGLAGALIVVTAYLSLVFMLVEMHGVMKTVRTPLHQPVLVFGTLAGLLGVGGAIWANYFYGRSFASSAIALTAPLALVAYVLAALFGPDWTPHAAADIFGGQDPVFEGQIWIAIGLMTLAILILAAVALAASTRLGQVLTLCVTLGVLLTGLLSDWFFARYLREFDSSAARFATATLSERTGYCFAKIAYGALPNFQVFWLADAINQDRTIPLDYIRATVPYGLILIGVTLCIAVALFQRREVG